MAKHAARPGRRTKGVAPRRERTEDRPQRETLVGKRIANLDAVEDALFYKKREALCENGARDVEVSGEVGEAADTEERVAHDEQRPAFADNLEGTGDGARLGGVLAGQSHPTSLSHLSSFTELPTL